MSDRSSLPKAVVVRELESAAFNSCLFCCSFGFVIVSADVSVISRTGILIMQLEERGSCAYSVPKKYVYLCNALFVFRHFV